MQNPVRYWLLCKIPQLSPPLNYTDDCNDGNDDDDDGDVSKVSFKPERKKWRRNPTSALPQNVPLTSSLRAILDNWLEIILFHTSPWSIRPLHSSCCFTVNQLAKNSHLGALQSNRFSDATSLNPFSFAVNLFSFKQRVTMWRTSHQLTACKCDLNI